MAEEAGPHLIAADRRPWQDRLTADHDNLRAALAWSVEADEGATDMRIATSIWRFWQLRGHLQEGRRVMSELLDLPSSQAPELAAIRARALLARAGRAYWQGETDTVAEGFEESLAIAREIGDRWAEAEALFNLSFVSRASSDGGLRVKLLEQSHAIFEELGDTMGSGTSPWPGRSSPSGTPANPRSTATPRRPSSCWPAAGTTSATSTRGASRARPRCSGATPDRPSPSSARRSSSRPRRPRRAAW